MNFEGKTAVITGGLGGIGYALADCLLQNNISALGILDVTLATNKVELLQKTFVHSKVVFFSCDVANRETVVRVFQNISNQFGRIDILINSAGILDENDAERCVKVNLLGVMNTCQTVIKYMDKQSGHNGGTVVNVASRLGLKTKQFLPVYCATKHGVVAYTRTMTDSYDYGTFGIKFMNVCPGKTQTPMIECLYETLKKCNESPTMSSLFESCQSAADCANCIVRIIKSAANGSTWSIKHGKTEQILVANVCDRVIDSS